ncbi:amino acid ABC transporter substrate-binding protein [Vreelandella titanicae]|uniref:amino acid ABC transporter substrate-binding protein n=1 Tax=Vreelandella titanicae TaxID=664683 RepID=UPI001144F745|nr:amino acid ABC transporter substrate-binding protein [Halomonas titanicae]NAO94519.1 transporter substrate-binding domain-containing protein [Halomonas sp. MG34]UEQ03489.1 amino acid ABC transporter substrate-binding protein [Halomonas profundus]|tara:strand:- start:6466 stop:7359 length:894 start_codon:yes stop_codon:yes gene_type:complete
MKWLVALLMTSAMWQGAAAGEEIDSSPTLSRIASAGEITIGHRTSEAPFSYLVNDQPTGYAIDLCLNVIEGLEETLGLGDLKVNYVPVTPANRFILVRNGEVDIECGVTTNTPERRRQAAFSYPHFLTATRYVSLAEQHMDSLQDLAGRSVVSTTGTINIAQLNELNRTEGLAISVMLSRNHEEAFDMVASGQASAFVMDEVLLAGLVSSAVDPAAFHISQATLSSAEPYGLMMPPDDPVFVELVNKELRNIYQSETIHTLYEKWFLQPLPPDNRVLNLPLAPALAAIFANPEQYIE